MEPNDANVGNGEALLGSVMTALSQGEALLQELDEETYTKKLPAAFNASIGGHYRHCLDHFSSLLNAVHSGVLNYDVRERGTLIEQDRFAALNATRELQDGYAGWPTVFLDHELKVTCKTSYDLNASQNSMSTVGREIMYIVAHAVHHYALIGVMAGLMGLKMPEGFGVAPSTMKRRKEEERKCEICSFK